MFYGTPVALYCLMYLSRLVIVLTSQYIYQR